MFRKTCSWIRDMGCCSCFGFTRRKPKQALRPITGLNYRISRDFLLGDDIDDDDDDNSYNGEATNTADGDGGEMQNHAKRSEEIFREREQNGLICRQFPVKESNKLIRSEVRMMIR